MPASKAVEEAPADEAAKAAEDEPDWSDDGQAGAGALQPGAALDRAPAAQDNPVWSELGELRLMIQCIYKKDHNMKNKPNMKMTFRVGGASGPHGPPLLFDRTPPDRPPGPEGGMRTLSKSKGGPGGALSPPGRSFHIRVFPAVVFFLYGFWSNPIDHHFGDRIWRDVLGIQGHLRSPGATWMDSYDPY